MENLCAQTLKPQDYIVVIGRQYASGGRRLGHELSAMLGVPYYDKELLREAADSLGFRPDLFEKADERHGSRIFSLIGASYGAASYFTAGGMHEGTLYQMQSDAIRKLLEKGPCVIVGRTADYIGRDLSNLVSIFLHADKQERIRRTLQRNPSMTQENVSLWLDKQDTTRRDYYNFYTGRKWGHADNYDLCLNTSRLDPAHATALVYQFLKSRADMD